MGNNPVNWIDPSGTTLIGSGPGSVAIIDIWPHQEPGLIADPTPEPPGSGILDGPQPGGGIIDTGLIIDRTPNPEPGAGIIDGPIRGGKCSGPIQGMDQPGVSKAEANNGKGQDKPRKKKEVIQNPDGTTTEIETRGTLGKDGATSQIIRVRDKNGNAISVQHVVTDAQGNIIHQHPKPIL